MADTVVQFFNNAKNAGLKVHLGMVPCWPMSPQDVAADLQKKFPPSTIERVWIFPFSFFPECNWNGEPQTNCLRLASILVALKAKGFKTGVTGSRPSWVKIFGY